jgi:cytochrome b561
MLVNSPRTYGSVSKWLHWAIAVLLILMLVGGFFMDDIIDKPLRSMVINLHKLVGIAILVLMLLRLLWRLCNVQPTLPCMPKWQRLSLKLVHRLLYLLVILMTLTGWIMSTAANHIPHIGSFTLPLPFVKSCAQLSDLFYSYHSILAWVIIAIVVLHILAALKHWLIDKDDVLQKML